MLSLDSRTRRTRIVLFGFLVTIASGFTTGCVHVAPYEREALAHPMMTSEDLASGMQGHVRAVSEGGSGGLSGGGGGCGCN